MLEDKNERNALVERHLPLVSYGVSEMVARVPAHVTREDLESAASVALVRAADSFDPGRGVPFARYASMRIRGALLDELRAMDWIPRGARQRARRVEQAIDKLASGLDRAPTSVEVAEDLGMTVAEVDAAMNDGHVRVLSMEAFDGALADAVVDPGAMPQDLAERAERIAYLRSGVECLPERMRYVVEQLFMHDRPVSDLADELGVTRSRISQMRSEALALLKGGLEANLDTDEAPRINPEEGVAERRRQAYYASIAAAHSAATGAISASAPLATVTSIHRSA